MRPPVSRRWRLPCGPAPCRWCEGGHKAPPLHQRHQAVPSAFSIICAAICAKPLRAKRRRLDVPLGAFSYISEPPPRGRCRIFVGVALCAPPPPPRQHSASVPLMGRRAFRTKIGHYVYRKRCNIMAIVRARGSLYGMEGFIFCVCPRSAGASCAPVPHRPHGGHGLQGARAGRAPPSPFGRALRALASALRPPRAPLQPRPPFPRHPRGRSAPRKRPAAALSGVPHRVFSFVRPRVPLGARWMNLGCE